MGGQGIERREVLRYVGLASVAGAFPGFHQWAFACAHGAADGSFAKGAVSSYQPFFFSAYRFRMVEFLAEMIIPADDTPGAKDAGVAEFIDFMVANRVPVSARYEMLPQAAMNLGLEVQGRFIAGLDWMNAHSKAEFGHEFLDCSAERQNSLLEELAYKAKYKPTTEMGRDFFQLIRDYTVVGYYTTKMGLESLGYPGLRSVWPKMPGCTHVDDPEHARVQGRRDSFETRDLEGRHRADQSL
jgi:gluconate 2-dehydrogenase gamma chain